MRAWLLFAAGCHVATQTSSGTAPPPQPAPVVVGPNLVLVAEAAAIVDRVLNKSEHRRKEPRRPIEDIETKPGARGDAGFHLGRRTR